MQKLKGFFKKFIKSEDGQGMTEYMLLLVLIIAIVALFRAPLQGAVEGKLSEIQERISSFGQ